ncbi:unnamed protein product [Miscanthus lutarioriparius]|uniref:NB-ARC domain-containing protein n=1 Tax=Miscanthus lutarioriparius TaxID=422564 RepID=A0A811PPV0_9POAL|nr:unnamed protein product [Miscanthus lutarioriparius]
MDAVGAATWIVQVVLEKLVGDGIDAAWAAAASGSDADPSSDVRRLRSRLQSLHLVLSAAQERVPRARGEALLSSLRRLRSLAGDADNLLDEMLYYQIHRQLHPDQASDSCSSISAVQSAISKIRGATAKRARLGDNDTTGRIKEILEQMCEAGNDVREAIKLEKLDAFVDLGCHDAYVHPRGQTTSFITELKVFGRDTVKKRIVAMLTSKEACDVHLSVLPIVGNGGIGKTTLAQLVYNDAVVQDHFSKRIWISVSIHFDEVRLTREMLECLSDGVSKHDEIINLNKLQEILEQSVKSKRLLLVLDDMWEDNDKSRWEKLLAPLRCSLLKGSVILVTTRNHSVVKMIATMDPIHLDGLEDDDFWLLFKSCVFGDEKYEGHWNLQIIGQNIAKRLKGYPLAAKSVGALLKRSLDGGQWMEILQSDEWKLQQGPDDIIPALKVSYIHLPFHLQRCFSYCALFPKGHSFDALELVRIWISQGLVSSKNLRMEETGHQYLNDLVDRGFFQRSVYYSMHDLMHDLALIVSSDECLVIDSFGSTNTTLFPTIQHLSINVRYAYKWNADDRRFYPNDTFQRKLAYIGDSVQTRNLSTLMLFGKYDAAFSETFSHVFKDVHHLRVLRLPTLTYNIDFLLRNFSKLIHLRYLELISSGPTEPFPEVICQLYHLQVLDVEFWVHLSALPGCMNNLVNLRHFVARGELHAMIAGVGRLKFLQELKVFRVGKTTDFEIGQLNGLRELGGSLEIYNLENVGSKDESQSAGLKDKTYLQDLLLSWSSNRCVVRCITEADVLEGLHPHSRLKRLHITWYGGISSPTWLCSNLSFICLESISLENCTKWEILPPLGQFPFLRKLYLIQLPASREVPTVSCNYWTGSEKQVLFPCLEELVVRDCPELMAFPLSQCSSKNECFCSFGYLREVTIYNCPRLMNLPPFGQVKSLSTISIEGVGSFPYIRLFMKALFIKGCIAPRTLDDILLLTECSLSILEKLTIESCLDLAYLSCESFKKLVSLESLVIVDCTRLSLPLYSYSQYEVMFCFPSLLKKLVIRACGITGKMLTRVLSQLHFMVCLTITKCPNITSIAVGGLITGTASSSTSDCHKQTTDGLLQIPSDTSHRLQYLCIEDFSDLILCKEIFHEFISLTTLRITGCPQLMVTMTIEKERSKHNLSLLPPSLKDLMVSHMHDKLCPFMLSNLALLSNLEISKSPELTSLDLHSCKSLKTLIIDKCVRLSVLEGLQSLANLKHLRIFECPSLSKPWEPSANGESQGLDFPLHLEKLEIDNTSFFKTCICKKLPFLQHVVFFMANNVRAFTEEQEKALGHLTSLQVLDFCYCPDLQSLPNELYCFQSLKKLSIKACPGLQSLPEKGLPASLQELYVSNCSVELKEQCRKIKNVRCLFRVSLL